MAHLPPLRASAFPTEKGEATGTKFSVLYLGPSLWYWVSKGKTRDAPTHTHTHTHFLSKLMAGAERESPSSLLTSNTSMSALLKSMLRILGRGTPEPRTAVKGVGESQVRCYPCGPEVAAWPKAASICKTTAVFSASLWFLPRRSPGWPYLGLLCEGEDDLSSRSSCLCLQVLKLQICTTMASSRCWGLNPGLRVY